MSRHTGFRCLETGVSYVLSQNTLTRSSCAAGACRWHRGRPLGDDGPVTVGAVTIDHRVMGGVPCIAGTRIPVATVVGLLGYTIDDVLADYPTVTREGILAGLRFAAK